MRRKYFILSETFSLLCPPFKIVVKAKHKPVLMFSLAALDAQETCGYEITVCVRLALWTKKTDSATAQQSSVSDARKCRVRSIKAVS